MVHVFAILTASFGNVVRERDKGKRGLGGRGGGAEGAERKGERDGGKERDREYMHILCAACVRARVCVCVWMCICACLCVWRGVYMSVFVSLSAVSGVGLTGLKQ